MADNGGDSSGGGMDWISAIINAVGSITRGALNLAAVKRQAKSEDENTSKLLDFQRFQIEHPNLRPVFMDANPNMGAIIFAAIVCVFLLITFVAVIVKKI